MSLRKIASIAAPVREQVVSQMRTAIEESHFEPGYRLVERELCEMLGVSRSTVREALRQLEAEGLVQSVPQIGAVVSLLDQEEQLRMIFEARVPLESTAVRLFVQRATPPQKEELDRICREIEAAGTSGDLRLMFRLKSRYYEVLEAGTGNAIISGQLRVLRTRLTMIRGRATLHWKPGQAVDSVGEVRRIVDAIRRHDESGAEVAAALHVDGALSRALAVLEGELARPKSENQPTLTKGTPT